ncbi:MAG: hypothetical protein ABIR39_15270 [Nocardioides sp.]|uniref:hypothetical protein n=1 Tax=Nocardioides sp. TaxID=35761 RepID=UPI0032679695
MSTTVADVRWLIVVLGLVVVATACSSSSSSSSSSSEPGTSPAPSASPPVVDFSATVTPGAEEIVVRWSLTNRSGDELLVPNLVPDSAGRFSSTANTVYVVPGTDADVELVKKAFEASGDAGDSLPSVGFTRLADGAVVEEVVRVPLPLSGYSPDGGASVPPDATSVVFCVGVVSPPFIASMGFNEHDGIETMNHGVAATQQHVFCSEPAEL